jgi:hypothetical protein
VPICLFICSAWLLVQGGNVVPNRKNQALAAEDRALKETSAPSSDKVVTGELGMSDKDVAARHERARQQGTAQHSEAAHELKQVPYFLPHNPAASLAADFMRLILLACTMQAIFADNPEAGANRAS